MRYETRWSTVQLTAADNVNSQVINVSIGREDDNDIFYFTGKENIWIQYGYLTKLSAILSDHFDLSGVVRSNSADLSQEMRAKLDARDDFIKALNNYLTWRAILPYISYLSKGKSVKL